MYPGAGVLKSLTFNSFIWAEISVGIFYKGKLKYFYTI